MSPVAACFAGSGILAVGTLALTRQRAHVIRWYLRAYTSAVNASLTPRLRRLLLTHVQHKAKDGDRVLLGSSTIARLGQVDGCVNLGVESLCTHHMLVNTKALAQLHPTVAVLYVGVNDTIFETPSSTIAANIAAIVRTVNAPHTVYVPIILSPYQRHLGDERCAYIERINRETTSVLPLDVTVVAPSFEDDEFNYDMLHLNTVGEAHLLREILEAVEVH